MSFPTSGRLPGAALLARRAAYDTLWLWGKDGRQRRELGLVDTSLSTVSEVDEGDEPVDEPTKPLKR